MTMAELVWQFLGTQQAMTILLLLILSKQIDHDINMANIIEALQESDNVADVQYKTIWPIDLPRFAPRKVS